MVKDLRTLFFMILCFFIAFFRFSLYQGPIDREDTQVLLPSKHLSNIIRTSNTYIDHTTTTFSRRLTHYLLDTSAIKHIVMTKINLHLLKYEKSSKITRKSYIEKTKQNNKRKRLQIPEAISLKINNQTKIK